MRAEEEDPMLPSRMSMSYSPVSPVVLCWDLDMACPPQGLLCRDMMGVVDFLSGQEGGNLTTGGAAGWEGVKVGLLD